MTQNKSPVIVTIPCFSGAPWELGKLKPFLKLRIKAAPLFPGALYREITLRFYAASLASPHDNDGQIPWSKKAEFYS